MNIPGFEAMIGVVSPEFQHEVVSTSLPMPPRPPELDHWCGHCGALPRSPCVSRRGEAMVDRFHERRLNAAERGRVLVVPCARCGAGINKPCENVIMRGPLLGLWHYQRREAAEKAKTKAQAVIDGVACPTCHADQGEECLNRLSRTPMAESHPDRVDAWKWEQLPDQIMSEDARRAKDALLEETSDDIVVTYEEVVEGRSSEILAADLALSDVLAETTKVFKSFSKVVGSLNQDPEQELEEDPQEDHMAKIVPEQLDIDGLRAALNEEKEWKPEPRARAWNAATGEGPFTLIRHVTETEELVHVRNPSPEAPNVKDGHRVTLGDWWLAQDRSGNYRTIATALLDPSNPKTLVARAWGVLGTQATLHVLYVVLLALTVGYVLLRS